MTKKRVTDLSKKADKVASNPNAQEGEIVSQVKSGRLATSAIVGRPAVLKRASMSLRASCGVGGGGFSSGGGGYGGYGGNTSLGAGGNFYSPELSTDFLELPQSADEERNFYRFFYDKDPFVGQAIDIHTEIPLSKVRLGIPEVKHMKNRPIAEMALEFCKKWAKETNLLEKLLYIVHEFYLFGEVYVFVEDESPEEPQDVRQEVQRVLNEEGSAVETWEDREDADERAIRWLKQNYKGWTDIRVLPPEQVQMKSFSLSKEKIFKFIPDSETKNVIEQADQGDPDSIRVMKSMSKEIVSYIRKGEPIPLNTDPEAGSFVYYMPNKKSQYEKRGHSMLERCLRTLIHRDKLRQAQASIASRHMTPMRLIWAEDADMNDLMDLREQIDLALQDPDYSIITNYEVHWEEMGSDQRLLDLSSEYDLTDRQLYAGLSMTESLLSGESSYSGDRINLEVINARYMLLRERIQTFVEKYIFEPMCKRMGFIEEMEEWGVMVERVLVPSLSFTRLALQDNSDTFDALFNLYQKGSVDVDVILELLNVDPVSTREKLRRDLFTLNDATFNEILRTIYSRAGDTIVEGTEVVARIAESLGLEYKPKPEGDQRF